MNNILRFLTLTTFFMIGFSMIASAQPGPPGGSAPIDGGATLLVGAVAYAGYRKLKARKEKNN